MCRLHNNVASRTVVEDSCNDLIFDQTVEPSDSDMFEIHHFYRGC
jgi:hypothetical protein